MPRAKSPSTQVAVPKSTSLVSYEDQLAALAKQSVEQEASVATGASFSTRGGLLSFNGTPLQGNQIDVVVVESVLENAYYDGPFDPDNPASPICYAFGHDADTMAPHPGSESPQSDSCPSCPQNKFGSADQGRGKACKNQRKLSLLSASPLDPEALRKSPLAFLKVPVTSVKGWADYVRTVSAVHRRPPVGVVTNVSVIPDTKTQFKVIFQHRTNLTKDTGMEVLARLPEAREALNQPYPKNSEREQSAPTPKRGAGKAKRY